MFLFGNDAETPNLYVQRPSDLLEFASLMMGLDFSGAIFHSSLSEFGVSRFRSFAPCRFFTDLIVISSKVSI